MVIDKVFHMVYYKIQEKEINYIDFTKRGGRILKCVITCLLLISIVANDFYNYKVNNVLILIGMVAGITCRVLENQMLGVVYFFLGFMGTILLLFLFFVLKLFGAGDIKALAVIGGLYGLPVSISCMVYSLFAGGVIALLSMIRSKTAFHRLYSLSQYVSGCVTNKKVTAYPMEEAKASGATIHFTLAILIGFVVTMEAGTII